MAPKTSLVALGNGEAKPRRGSLCPAEADTLARVCFLPQWVAAGCVRAGGAG